MNRRIYRFCGVFVFYSLAMLMHKTTFGIDSDAQQGCNESKTLLVLQGDKVVVISATVCNLS